MKINRNAFCPFISLACILQAVTHAEIRFGTHVLTDSDTDYLTFGKYMRVPLAIQDPTHPNYHIFNGTDVPAIKALENPTGWPVNPSPPPVWLPVQVEIYDKMKGGAAVFNFADIDAAMRVIKARLAMIEKMNLIWDEAHGFNYNTLPDASTDSTYWEKHAKHSTFLWSKADVSPWDAIHDIFNNRTSSADCASVIALVTWWGVAQGCKHKRTNAEAKQKFDSLFQGTHKLDPGNKTGYQRAAGGNPNELIPGDYLRIENYIYSLVVSDPDKIFYELGLDKNKKYLFGSESCVYLGYELTAPAGYYYAGLGMREINMHTALKDHFNSEFDLLITNRYTKMQTHEWKVNGETHLLNKITDLNLFYRVKTVQHETLISVP